MAHFYTRISFIIGIVIGVFLALVIKKSVIKPTYLSKEYNKYEEWFKIQGYNKTRINWDELRYTNKTFYLESQFLFDKVKIVCIILVKNEKYLQAANSTWARGCNKIQAVKLQMQNKIMPKKQSKDKSSWVLLYNILKSQDVEDFQWTIIIKDTSFALMDNLRYLVAPLNNKEKYYLGYGVKFWGTLYNSGEAGYVLSQGTIKELQAAMEKTNCLEFAYWNREDYYLGKCLNTFNITPTNILDNEGFSLFHPYIWYNAFFPGEDYFTNNLFPYKCCSTKSVSFKVNDADKMFTYHYLFYKLQVFSHGFNGNIKRAISQSEDKKVWMNFLKSQGFHDDNITSDLYYKVWENLINDPTSFAQNMKKEDLFDY
ncbi:glycoprotein-N-acetylgalactosamine 3-beta-galactosyltransferase 1-like [Rhynchophorus ferrugineus]|uniref:glycoprotein-N-acetylgalactosamine 3-beta-galactosyltransferase 1-like n=1 Tax=Rhynchophorus ferrugineus TaxID=354439 RepID=UPI003FCEB66F